MTCARTIMAWLVTYGQRSDGATAIEYGLIASGISLAITLAVFTFGDTLNTMFFTELPAMLHP